MKSTMRSRAAWAIGLAGAASVAACNLIVGVDGYKIEDGGSADGPTGAPEADVDGAAPDMDSNPGPTKDGSTADASAADANQGDGTLGGDARPDGGAHDAHPDAVVVADAAGDVTDARTTVTPDGGAGEAAVACGDTVPTGQPFRGSTIAPCVAATSCDPYLVAFSLSDCISSDLLGSTGDAGTFSCLQGANDCTAYFQCQGTRYASTTECPDDTSRCVGTTAIDCSGIDIGGVPFPGTVTDCSKAGATCQTYTDQFTNSRAGCIVAPTCDPSNGDPQCMGNDLFSCVLLADGGGIGDGRSCGAATCTPATGGATCSFARDICVGTTGASCSGSEVTCTASSQTATYDCTRAGATCGADTGPANCVSPGCTLGDCVEACDSAGTSATVCVGGAPLSVRCEQFQYSTTDAYGSCSTFSGNAFCVP